MPMRSYVTLAVMIVLVCRALFLLVTLILVSSSYKAQAAEPMITGIGDPYHWDSYRDGIETANYWKWYARGAGSQIIHQYVLWDRIAPASPTVFFDADNPSDPQYNWSGLDQMIRTNALLGMATLATVFRAPSWAEGPNPPPTSEGGFWKPNPYHYALFAKAIATRYSGNYIPSGATSPLPRIRYWEAWNEPNLSHFNNPQWSGKTPVGVSQYRALASAFYGAVKGVRADNQVFIGALAPNGSLNNDSTDANNRPVDFLRTLLCIKKNSNDSYSKTCSSRVQMDGLSFHPIVPRGGSCKGGHSPSNPSCTTSNFSPSEAEKLSNTLKAAQRLGTIDKKQYPIWGTEFWFHSQPTESADSSCGMTQTVQSRYIAQTFYELWKDGVDAALYYTIADKRNIHKDCNWSSTGLYTGKAEPKPSLKAYLFPLVVANKGKTIWLRPPGNGEITIEAQTNSGWTTIRKVSGVAGLPVQASSNIKIGQKVRARQGEDISFSWTR